MDERNVESNQSQKEGKATKSSLFAQVFSAIWIGGWCSYKFIADGINTISVNDIVYAGIGVVGCFSPVFLNMLMDKVQNIRFNGNAR